MSAPSAAGLRAGDGAVTLDAAHGHMWPDTLAIMGRDVDDTGPGVVFGCSIPEFVQQASALPCWPCSGLRRDAKGGGPFRLSSRRRKGADRHREDHAPASRQPRCRVLRATGNMSAPTVLFVLFVLKDVLAQGHTGRRVLIALGPGFTDAHMPLAAKARP